MAGVLKSLLHEKDSAINGDNVTENASGSSGESTTKAKKSKKMPKIPPYKKRDRSKSTYSIISLSEVTEGALQIWRTLPEKIRQDPSLASFRQENERIHGE